MSRTPVTFVIPFKVSPAVLFKVSFEIVLFVKKLAGIACAVVPEKVTSPAEASTVPPLFASVCFTSNPPIPMITAPEVTDTLLAVIGPCGAAAFVS
ncbi:hypothetical protein D9M69_680380 [compost metagenome]